MRNTSRNGKFVCPGCDHTIDNGTRVWIHQQLNCYIHGRIQCMKSVYGEDVTTHSMTPSVILY